MADALFQVPLFIGNVILFSIVFFAAKDNSRHSAGQRQCLRKSKVFLPKDSWHKVERAREVSRAEGEPFTMLKRIGQGVLFPKDVIVDAQFTHQFEDFIVGSKEDMQATFDPITVAVAPRRNFATKNVAAFE